MIHVSSKGSFNNGVKKIENTYAQAGEATSGLMMHGHQPINVVISSTLPILTGNRASSSSRTWCHRTRSCTLATVGPRRQHRRRVRF